MGILNFEPGEGTLTIAGQSGGSSKANITIENMTSATTGGGTSELLLDGHSVSINAGTIIVARLGGSTANSINGAMTFDTGTINVDSLQIAVSASGSNPVGPVGTFTFGGASPNNTATGVMNVNTQFYLVNRTNTAGGPAVGTLTHQRRHGQFVGRYYRRQQHRHGRRRSQRHTQSQRRHAEFEQSQHRQRRQPGELCRHWRHIEKRESHQRRWRSYQNWHGHAHATDFRQLHRRHRGKRRHRGRWSKPRPGNWRTSDQ